MHPSRIQNDTPCGQAATQHGHSYWKKWKSILPKKIWQISTICAVTRNICGHNWDVWLSCLYFHLTQTIHAIITHFTKSNLSKPSVSSLQNNTRVQDSRFSRCCCSTFRSSVTSCHTVRPVAPDALAVLSKCGTHTAWWHSKKFRNFFDNYNLETLTALLKLL